VEDKTRKLSQTTSIRNKHNDTDFAQQCLNHFSLITNLNWQESTVWRSCVTENWANTTVVL